MADMDTTEKFPAQQDGHENPEDAAHSELTQEERELKEKEWKEELSKTEEEVNTLRQVLASKQKRVNDLRRLLGIGIVSKLSKDVNTGIHRLSETEVMVKANSALKSAGEKTSAAFTTVGKKLEDVKNSEFVKSFEEKVGHAYDSVKRSKSLFAIGPEAKVGGAKMDPATAATGEDVNAPPAEKPQ